MLKGCQIFNAAPVHSCSLACICGWARGQDALATNSFADSRKFQPFGCRTRPVCIVSATYGFRGCHFLWHSCTHAHCQLRPSRTHRGHVVSPCPRVSGLSSGRRVHVMGTILPPERSPKGMIYISSRFEFPGGAHGHNWDRSGVWHPWHAGCTCTVMRLTRKTREGGPFCTAPNVCGFHPEWEQSIEPFPEQTSGPQGPPFPHPSMDM